jgi:hypothetical protein
MPKANLSKLELFVPSIETARRIDDQDNALAVQAAVYRAETKLADLRGRYESECSRVRTAMLAEVAALELGEAAE